MNSRKLVLVVLSYFDSCSVLCSTCSICGLWEVQTVLHQVSATRCSPLLTIFAEARTFYLKLSILRKLWKPVHVGQRLSNLARPLRHATIFRMFQRTLNLGEPYMLHVMIHQSYVGVNHRSRFMTSSRSVCPTMESRRLRQEPPKMETVPCRRLVTSR